MKARLWIGLAASISAMGVLVACSGAEDSGQGQAGSAVEAAPDGLPKDFQLGSASQKLNTLWANVTKDEYPAGQRASWSDATFESVMGLSNFTAPFLRQSFDTNSDEQPFVIFRVHRKKLIHALGSAVQIKLVKAPGSPYTGLFEGGVGIGRFSLAIKPMRDPAVRTQFTKFTPGFALKILVDGKPSLNLHTMPGVDGIEGFEFFSRPFSNAVPVAEGGTTGLLVKAFENAVSPARRLGLRTFASVDQHGAKPAAVKVPAQIFLIGTKTTKELPGQSEDVDFRESLERIPQGPIFDVFAKESGEVITDPAAVEAAIANGTIVKIATLHSTSRVVSSAYEDEKLLFKHEAFTD